MKDNQWIEIDTEQRKEYKHWMCSRCGMGCTGTCQFLRRFIEIEEETEKRVKEAFSDNYRDPRYSSIEYRRRKARQKRQGIFPGKKDWGIYVWSE